MTLKPQDLVQETKKDSQFFEREREKKGHHSDDVGVKNLFLILN